MIVVNCKDIPSEKSALAVYTADQVGAIPALKIHEFVLSPLEDEEIDVTGVITAIRMFLASIGREKNFAVTRKNNIISVVSIDGYKIGSSPQKISDQFFSCIHCGHVTQFETVHNNHMKIHYL